MKIHTISTARPNYSYIHFIEAAIVIFLLATTFALSIPALNLRSTESFVILAGSTVTGIPPVNIVGNVGLSPAAGSFIAGFDGSNVTGTLYVVDASGPSGSVVNATLLQTAKSDLTTAYNEAAGRTPVPTGTFLNPGSGNMGGLNLVAGLYKFTSNAAITGSNLTLTGSASDVWIFQIASALNLGSGISIILAGGAQASNIFWQVGTSATLGTYSVFKGTILADQSISLGTGATMDGRALAFSAAVTMASGVTTNRPVATTTGPIFSVNPSQLAFGYVNNGSTKRDSVTVTNTGTADLIISSVTSSNTLYTISPSNGTITPGSTRKFYITFAPLANISQNGKIYFNHNAPSVKDSIQVSGVGELPVFNVTPLSLNFGTVKNGLSKRDSVIVTNTGTANLVISSVTSSNLRFTVTPSTGTLTPGSTMKYYVTFSPLVDGLQNARIYFNHNAASIKDSIQVRGLSNATGNFPIFSINPSSLNFGNLLIGSIKMDSVTVTNTGLASLIISNSTVSNIYFNINPTSAVIPAGTSMKFYISFAPLVTGIQNADVVFYHNGNNGKDSIPVTGSVIGSTLEPKFSVTPSSLDFGSVFIGINKQKSVTVKNIGTANLIISSVISTDVHFTVTPLLGTMTPGGTQDFFITFSPTVVGLINAKIIFSHNDGKDTINVTGNGIDNLSIITIDAARKLPIGSEFVIEGIVTRSLGDYTRIQDNSAGLTIIQKYGLFFNDVENKEIGMGDKLRIQGKISEVGFLKVIDGSDLTGYQRLSRSNTMPSAVKVTLSELVSNGEKYESCLITLDKMTVAGGNDLIYMESKSYQTIDQSNNSNLVEIRIGNHADTDMDGMPFNGTSVTFVGVLSQSSLSNPLAGYQLTPVLSTDLFAFPTSVNGETNQSTLSDNYPNPFNASTLIQYNLENSDFVSIKVFNVLGKEVATLVNSIQEAGSHDVTFTASGSNQSLESGVYYYSLTVGRFVSAKQMIFVK